MPLTNFNVVLVGENFPVTSIKVADFEYRGRALKERMRVPVVVQAENELVSMQVLPDRFEVTVKSPDQLDIQTKGVSELVSTFLDYVGRRTVSAVGHNARWTIPKSLELRDEIARAIVNSGTLSEVLGTDKFGVDVAIAFKTSNGGTGRMTVATIAQSDVVLDFNFHFDVPAQGEPAEIVALALSSLTQVSALAENIEAIVAKVRA